MILIFLLLIFLLCGGGFWRYPQYREPFGGGFLVLLVVLLLAWHFGYLGR
jgi:hypothetical protein